MNGEFDFVIVGAGTAGCVLADRLSADPSKRVLLLEAGGEATSPWIGVPIGYARLLGNPRYNWLYSSAPEPELGGRVLEVPCGRVIGGTGSINAMLHVQGQREDYDYWRSLGHHGWGWEDVRPWFERLKLPRAAPPQRHVLADAFIAAAAEAGHPVNADFNGPTQEGAGYYQLNATNAWRASTASTYLRDARRRPNLAVATHALVARILFEDGAAIGVEYRRDGITRTARSRREVILAAGAFNSPQLLQRSGVGFAGHLQSIGVPVVMNLPTVGEGLQNHFRAPVVVRCRQPVTHNDVMRSSLRKAGMALDYLLRRRGPMAAGTYAGGFFRTPGAARPDIQVTFWTYSVASRGAAGVVLHDHPGFTANAVIIRPRSCGYVRATSARPEDKPQIRFNHLAEAHDRRGIVAGLRLVRGILAQPAMAAYFASELAPGAPCHTDEALLGYARDKGGSVFHPVGTCAIGAVVDARLRVKGLRRLRVADASVMPSIVSGNTNAPTAMIAERAAAWALGAQQVEAGERAA